MKPLTILLHGWSDTAKSFVGMKAFLRTNGINDVDEILFGEYESREDALTFHDIVDGFHEQLIERGIIARDGTSLRDINVVVHSTGGLVIRHWLWRYYRRDGNRIAQCPLKRLVMLAPANFGSPLAHRGKSFFGSLVKGRKDIRDLGSFFEVGRILLDGLELASPFQWELAERDTLVSDSHFTPTQVQLSVLVGVDGYSGLKAVVDKPGTDGTVVVAGTPLNSLRFQLKPSWYKDAAVGSPYTWVKLRGGPDHGFGVLAGYNHSTIVSAFSARADAGTGVCAYLLRALRTKNASQFRALRDELAKATHATYSTGAHRVFQQFLVRVRDNHDQPVDDYTLVFAVVRSRRVDAQGFRVGTADSAAERAFSDRVQRAMTAEAHQNRTDPSVRRFLVEPEAVERILGEARQALGEDVSLVMRVFVPPVDRGVLYEAEALRAVELWPATSADAGRKRTPTLLFPNTTTFLEIAVNRATDLVWLGTRPAKR